MLNLNTPSRLTHALASTRLSINSFLQTMQSGMDMLISGRIGAEQPRMAMVPVSKRRQPVNGHGNADAIGANAHAAVCMYADPVTKGWRVLNFGKTDTGKTGHSQPSRFAP